MDKELALAMEFKSAPKELQAAATAHYDSEKLVAKIKNKCIEANLELEKALIASEVTQKAYRIALKNWEPVIK